MTRYLEEIKAEQISADWWRAYLRWSDGEEEYRKMAADEYKEFWNNYVGVISED